MCRKLVAWVSLTFALSAIGPSLAEGHSLKELEQILGKQEFYLEFTNRPAPTIALNDASGQRVGLDDLRGKVVVLNFIYASCREACPLQSDMIARIQQIVDITPLRDSVRFVSITTDPERDTPELLKEYGPAHRLDPTNWIFLTSGSARPTATRDLGEQYGLKFTRTEDGDFIHGVVTHVIDKNGVLRARFHGLDFDPANLAVYVSALVSEEEPAVEQGDASAKTPVVSEEPRPERSSARDWWWKAIVVIWLGSAVVAIPLWRLLRRRKRRAAQIEDTGDLTR